MVSKEAGGNVLLAVTGSIAAYKACSVLRGLMRRGHQVQVVMSEAAGKLISPTTFRALSGRPVVTGLWVPEGNARLQHIELAEWAGVLAIAPATANIIGKVVWGIADEIVSTTWMACDCPKVVAPAMNDRMWMSAAVQRNAEQLDALEGVTLIRPVAGRLASGKEARTGRLAPVERIVEVIDSLVRGE